MATNSLDLLERKLHKNKTTLSFRFYSSKKLNFGKIIKSDFQPEFWSNTPPGIFYKLISSCKLLKSGKWSC